MDLDVIYNEDCLIGMDRIPDKSINMVLCDPPYQQTSRNKWDTIIPFEQFWIQIDRIAKDNAAIVLFANGMFTADLMQSNRKNWRYNLIWKKTQPTGFMNSHKMPLRAHEDICIFYRKLPTYNPQKTTGARKISKASHHVNAQQTLNYGKYEFADYDSIERYPISVIEFAKDTQKSSWHPTQKPLALCEWLIKTYTNPGDIVCDPCAGSMTTAIACRNTGRRYICFEKDKEIYNIGIQRIESEG